MRLIDAPVGLFMWNDTLCLKTEYFTNGRVEAYVVSSGECFWGGVRTAEEVNNIEVIPIDTNSEVNVANKERRFIFGLIDKAMARKDRYISVYLGQNMTSINIYPVDEEDEKE